MPSAVNQTLDHLFRHEYGKLVSLFANKYSPHLIDTIEDAVQEALYKAARQWSFQPMPNNPSAWLYRVVNNQIIDYLRKEAKSVSYEQAVTADAIGEEESRLPEEKVIVDDQLRMIFACCHPAMKPTEQLMLSLKLLCGLSVKEIARALLKQEEATKRAITRAKVKFREEVGALKVPEGGDLENRLEAVLQVIYLLFNEGYKATEGNQLMKQDLCEEAIRLAFLLTNERSCNKGELKALIAMMLFKAARFPARTDEAGNLLTLENQDRSKYDEEHIKWGWHFLHDSSKFEGSSVYQLEAAISCYYTTAETYEKTNWKAILSLYDTLVKLKPVPVVQMSRILVLSKVKGATAALKEMEGLEEVIEGNQSLLALKADLYAEIGNWSAARVHLQKAIGQALNITERRFLEKKLQSWIGK
ncbi:RNA polymerase sigma factor [Roseivirga thermotolerans]|uniref:DNA-directed RNA polymerase sigma-70 factor n=1 Tax=Roseivirga thermotolerans TaxID=1758176 RepID=A0ABQ3I3F2_9BACT|nr:sigma-70 family RNA polymerase sigma factor [Roseivirga thermotolerans]GHE59504.1 DNA-directed RNA polymerase sigma-70 factor [Roseivirga thermotolerans]